MACIIQSMSFVPFRTITRRRKLSSLRADSAIVSITVHFTRTPTRITVQDSKYGEQERTLEWSERSIAGQLDRVLQRGLRLLVGDFEAQVEVSFDQIRDHATVHMFQDERAWRKMWRSIRSKDANYPEAIRDLGGRLGEPEQTSLARAVIPFGEMESLAAALPQHFAAPSSRHGKWTPVTTRVYPGTRVKFTHRPRTWTPGVRTLGDDSEEAGELGPLEIVRGYVLDRSGDHLSVTLADKKSTMRVRLADFMSGSPRMWLGPQPPADWSDPLEADIRRFFVKTKLPFNQSILLPKRRKRSMYKTGKKDA